MPPPKKAALNAASRHTAHDDAEKDLRRAYEHLGRVEILHRTLDRTMNQQATETIAVLTDLAQHELAAGHRKDAADLLRAAEHLCFGGLHSAEAERESTPRLVDAVTREFHQKLGKAEEHWSKQRAHDEAIETVYLATADRAQQAFDQGAFRKSLELARAADALAHVTLHRSKQLGSGTKHPELQN